MTPNRGRSASTRVAALVGTLLLGGALLAAGGALAATPKPGFYAWEGQAFPGDPYPPRIDFHVVDRKPTMSGFQPAVADGFVNLRRGTNTVNGYPCSIHAIDVPELKVKGNGSFSYSSDADGDVLTFEGQFTGKRKATGTAFHSFGTCVTETVSFVAKR